MIAASDLFTFHYGQARRDAIFAEVDFARERDRREIDLGAAGVRALLDACHAVSAPWLIPIVTLALATSAEQGFLLRRLKVRHVELGPEGGSVYLDGTKTDERARTVDVGPGVCGLLRPFAAGKAPDDLLLTLDGEGISRHKLRYWFDKARKEAGMPELRFHDLRHAFGAAAEEIGVPLTVIQRCMGHVDPDMTRQYQLRQATLGRDNARSLEEHLGLTRSLTEEVD